MSMRPKSTARDLAPRLLRRERKLVSGKLWVGYYYNGYDENGKRKEIPLGTDLNEAKRKWAELECQPAPVETGLMKHIFDRYIRDVLPTKAHRTQQDNLHELKQLRAVFDSAPVDAITPQHIAQYRDKRTAKVRANRELSLLSHVYNMAREWGYTARENPCRGIRKNKETPRAFYVDDAVWQAVYSAAAPEMQDAMDVAYLTGQRPADVLKIHLADIDANAITVLQNKTGKRLRILLNDDTCARTQLGQLVDKIRTRPRKIRSMHLVALPSGQPMNTYTLRTRFEAAREEAAANAPDPLAERIKQFQFRDIRPKAASEISDLDAASKLLGHTDKQITNTVYRRVGESVKPTK